MKSDVLHQEAVHQQVAGVAQALHQRTDELAVLLARVIAREVRLYRTEVAVPFDVVADGCAANMRPILSAIAAETAFDSTAATVLGKERARDGVPLASVMEAYRVGFRRLWEAVLAESANRAEVNGEALRVLTTKLLTAQDVFTESMAVGYRQEQTCRLHSEETHRSLLLDSLLQGRLLEQYGVWDAADCLHLPSRGPFVVIAAEVALSGAEALPDVESKLRSRDLFSAWRLLPDLQVGIVYVKSDKQLAAVLAVVSRMATRRVGVSARFEDLRETGQALRYARMMLRDHAKAESPVAVFDGSVLATAAVSAPEVMVKLVTPTMQCFSGLADQEREILFETFRVWLENDGSLSTVGKLMFCHPNTVRYRLHRIEHRTGRSLSRPRDVAELCLAFEVQRRLM